MRGQYLIEQLALLRFRFVTKMLITGLEIQFFKVEPSQVKPIHRLIKTSNLLFAKIG